MGGVGVGAAVWVRCFVVGGVGGGVGTVDVIVGGIVSVGWGVKNVFGETGDCGHGCEEKKGNEDAEDRRE